MQAIVVTEPGGPDVLKIQQVPDPHPQRGEVRVKIRAIGINRADVLRRKGLYPAPADCPQDIPGLEFAGEIDALGEAVTEYQVGDRVCGLIGGGAYAQLVVVHNLTLSKIPDNMSYTDAAAIPEAFITAYDALVSQCHLAPGDTVLVTAAGSGVGTAAVQIATAMGAKTIGVSRTESKLDRLRALDLEHGILEKDGKFADRVMEVTSGRGADIILELIGGDYISQDILCLASQGTLIVAGALKGNSATIDFGRVLTRRLTIRGTVLLRRPIDEKIQVARTFARHVLPLFANGSLKPVIDKVYRFDQVAEAHAYLESNSSFGKIVLSVDD